MQPKDYGDQTIDHIWSMQEWEATAQALWLKINAVQRASGWKAASKKIKNLKLSVNTGHEVIDALNRLINSTGLVNLHAGLTSSDIVDNVRLIQIVRSRYRLANLIDDVIGTLKPSTLDESTCLGYTHWQAASLTTVGHRFTFYADRLQLAADAMRQPVRQKTLGGAVGDGRALRIILGEKGYQRLTSKPLLDKPTPLVVSQLSSIQSSDYTEELQYAHCLSLTAAVVHKLALDMRFLMHTGEIKLGRSPSYRGSSSMPHKNNPSEFERVCALARLVQDAYRVAFDCMAHNGLERTLDNSAALKVALPQASRHLAFILGQLAGLVPRLKLDHSAMARLLTDNGTAATSELRMAKLIKEGKTRVEAYEEVWEQVKS